MEGRSHSHKDLPRLLTHPRAHHLRSSWHADDRELEGYLVMRTPFLKKICASGACRGRDHFIFTMDDLELQFIFSSLSTQWLPQSQIVRPDFPP